MESQKYQFEVPNMSGLPSFKQPERPRNTNRQTQYQTYKKQPLRSDSGYTGHKDDSRYNEVQKPIETRYKKPYSDHVEGDEYDENSDYNEYWEESEDIPDDEDMLRNKYPGFGDINTQRETR